MAKAKIHQAIRFVGVDDDSQDYTWTGESFWLTLPNGDQANVYLDAPGPDGRALVVQTWGPGNVAENDPFDTASVYLPGKQE